MTTATRDILPALPIEARPAGAGRVRMVWHDLLFAHWPICVDELRHHVPAGLAIEKYDGRAWVGVIPFRMSGIRLRGWPPVPGASAFCELNVRTYVRRNGVPGVWFFSLDAASALGVAVARRWYRLNYLRAEMACRRGSDGWIDYRCRRRDGAAAFQARYRPTGDAFTPASGSLAHFLTERYSLYAEGRDGAIYRACVDHAPWVLQPAEAEMAENSMLGALGIAQPTSRPHLLYGRRQDAVAWAPQRI